MNRNINNNVTNAPEHTYVTIQSNASVNWGGYCNFDININNYCIHEITLLLNVGAITGITASSLLTLPAFCSAFKWFTQVNITNQNNSLDIYDSQSNFLMNQMYTSLEDSYFINGGAGPYNSLSTRYSMSQTNTVWQVPLKTGIFNQLKTELLNNNHNIRVSVLLDNLTNIINQGSLTGTPACVINSCSLILKVSKYDQITTNNKLLQLSRLPSMKLYNSTAYQPFIANLGSSQSIIALSNFIGLNVQYVYFVIHLSTAITKSESFSLLNNISNYSILSSSGESLVGSTTSSSVSLLLYNKHSTCGNFTTDSTYGNVFTIWHSIDPVSTIMQSGGCYGQRLYSGSESLVINYSSALSANCNIDIYASCSSILKQTNLGFTKIIV